MRFIHAADIHLDSPLRGLERYEGVPADEIRGATRRALENLIDLALEEEVDFVLIAGDLYDGDWKDHNTGLFFVAQMTRLREADVPVIMISGNHDAANKMTKSLRLPDNVQLLSHKQAGTAHHPKLEELGVAIHGRSFERAAEYDNLARDYPPAQSGHFNIGLLHTSLGGVEGHEPYAPCTIEELRQKRYDYWALGHVHNRALACEEPLVVYPGNIQGRHIRESGEKGCYLVTVDRRGEIQLDFRALDVFRWEICNVSATGAEVPDSILDRFTTELYRLLEVHAHLPLAVRVIVSGESPVHDPLVADPIRWTNQIRATALDVSGGRVWIEKVKFATSPVPGTGNLAGQDGPIAALLSYIDELRGDDEELLELVGELSDLRRKLPDELTRGDEAIVSEDPQQLRLLLDEIRPLLIRRLSEGLSS